MDKLDKRDVGRFMMAEYRILVKNVRGKVVATSEANKSFKDSPMEFEQVNETTSSLLFEKAERVNTSILQMKVGKKPWVDIGFRIFATMILAAGDSLHIKWSLKITTEGKTITLWG